MDNTRRGMQHIGDVLDGMFREINRPTPKQREQMALGFDVGPMAGAKQRQVRENAQAWGSDEKKKEGA